LKVTLFIPCLVDQFFPETAISVVKVLRRVGVEVEYPTGQTCCGQPAFNSGYWREARSVAEHFLRSFERAELIVAPSGSCVAMVRTFYQYLFQHTSLADLAAQISERTLEFSEFLVQKLHVADVQAQFPGRATYHEACHLLRELHVREEPRQLLSAVRGLELVEMDHSAVCCGFGGTFSAKFPEISTAMAEQKIDAIEKAGVEYVIANDSGCLMQIAGLLKRRGSAVQAIHLAEVLATQG